MKKEKPQRKSQNSFKLLVVVFSFSILLFNFVHILADEPNDSDFVYLFHLYYDNDQLLADRDFEFKYDVIPEGFVAETFDTQFPFKGEIVNFKNEVAAEFQFDPRRGNPNFLKGKISVKAPYVSDGQKVVFYDSQNRQLLTIFVSDSSFCNDDGFCNLERGEDDKTCPNDCMGAVPTPPVSGEPPSGQSNILKSVIYVLIIVGAALGSWYGWKRRKRKKETVQLNQFNNKLP